MTSSSSRNGKAVRPVDELPPALPSMWRLCKLGFRFEPNLMFVALVLALLSALPAAFAAPTVMTAIWRPTAERVAQERGAQFNRLARHLFTLAATAPPGKEVRVTGIAERLIADRRAAWERWYGPISITRWQSAAWHTLAWAVFGGAYVGAVVFVAYVLAAPPGSVLLVLAAGARLSAY